MGRFSRQSSFLHLFFSSFFKLGLRYCLPSGDISTRLSPHKMGTVKLLSRKSCEKGRVLEFETKRRKMSWLEKSAGIIMSEIILGNAEVCCKGPGKSQFITSPRSDSVLYTQTWPPSQPAASVMVGNLTLSWEVQTQHNWVACSFDTTSHKKPKSGAEVTCHHLVPLNERIRISFSCYSDASSL